MTPDMRATLARLIRDLRTAGFGIAAVSHMGANDTHMETRDFSGRTLRRESRADYEARERRDRFSVRER
jgi:hypothetical protein